MGNGICLIRAHGAIVLRSALLGDFGPEDRIPFGCAAGLVFRWAFGRDRSPAEREVAVAYLRQWAEGPQLA